MSSLSTLLASVQKGFLKNVLTGAGVTLGTAGISLAILNTMLTQFKNSVGSLPVVLLQMAGVTGLHIYFSLVLGAIVAVHYKKASPLHLLKKK
ncbi:DUF2523 family protein [Acinetobacter bereziniae]|uniref:DUF2523 family protein n=1 Tax=Acinetobacter bereziniae TaxID=106648 RepID=UPI0012500D51|nr:DUF2523 family protein [Acinetobacter bereziniae]MBJ9909526.1 DUF2523 domain-containing protein [Acinetobacter bereziniae]MBJ9931230.1 DUF2523 domain-containing protein [Acinetobacter bereziniae]